MRYLVHAYSFFFDLLAARRSLLVKTLLAVTGFNLMEVAIPKVLQMFVDSVAGRAPAIFGFTLGFLKTPGDRIAFFTLALMALSLLRWAMNYLRRVLETRLGQGALYDLRNRIYDQMQSLSFAYHDRAHSGRLIANTIEDVQHIQMFFTQGLFQLLEVVVGAVCIYAYMMMACWQAGLVALALLFLGVLAEYVFFKRAAPVFRRTRKILEDVVSTFSEHMEGHLVVRAFGRHAEAITTYGGKITNMMRALWREILAFTGLSQALQLSVLLGIPAVLAVALVLRRGGADITAGDLVLLLYLQNLMKIRIRWLAHATLLWMRFAIASERLGELFRADEYLPDPGEGRERCDLVPRGAVEFDNVSFAYGGRAHSLRAVTLRIEEGQTVGLVGESGAGKSTLALLLCRFYDPDSGIVRIGGRDIRGIPVAALRGAFSLIFQDTFLFSASVRENIAYGRSHASFEEVIHAATLAEAHDFIMQLPDGYDTIVGERGVTISGGQRQRIAIARALLRRPRFLVLDDATSSLDTQTEGSIQQSLRSLPQTTTRIIIAHRFSSIAEADVVYVLRDGEIVEQGKPGVLDRPGTALSRILQRHREAI